MFKNKQFICSLLLIVLGSGFTNSITAQDSDFINIVDPTKSSPEQYVINEIIVKGIETARESYIISSSGLQVGSTITIPGDEISTAIFQLHRTGLFEDVEIQYEERTASAVNIIISVREMPRLDRFEFDGIKKSQRKDLREEVNLLRGFAVTKSVRSQAITKIKDYYLEKG